MKSIAALGAGTVIATVAALWFTTRPVLVNAEIRPLPVNANLPAFRQTPSKFQAE
jgi:hypothetical protein